MFSLKDQMDEKTAFDCECVQVTCKKKSSLQQPSKRTEQIDVASAVNKQTMKDLKCILRGSCHAEVQELAHASIYIVSKNDGAKDEKVHLQLFRAFAQMYERMIDEAKSAYNLLEKMRQSHVLKHFEDASVYFQEAQGLCLGVGVIIQHIIDIKFALSAFKCHIPSCDNMSHSVSHLGFTPSPRLSQKCTNKVPAVFENKKWNRKVTFQDRELTHFDYVYEQAMNIEDDFHTLVKTQTQKFGVYYAGPLKKSHRCIAKIKTDFTLNPKKYPFNPISMYLKDVVRGTILCNNINDMKHIAQALKKYICNVKDRLQIRQHDVLLNLFFEGLVCEVQMHFRDFYVLTRFSHGPYEVERASSYKDLIDEVNGKLLVHSFQLDD